MASMEHVPNDLLVEILKSSHLNYVDRWNCLLTCKQFKQAVLTPRLWTHVTIQTSPIFYVRDDEEQRKDPKPKELSIHATALMQFLHKNFPRDVVELDLSDGHFESEASYNQRKYDNYSGQYTTDKYVWKTIYGFPNLTKLSLKNISCPQGRNELPTMPAYANQKSSITHLNLVGQELFTLSNKALEMILEACPKLVQLQMKGEDLTVDATELFAKYTPNIKELLCIKGELSASQLSMSCPELEVLILSKGQRSPWDNEEETEAPTLKPEITFYNGYHDNIWTNKKFTKEQVKKLQKALQSTTLGDYWGTPFVAKMLEAKEDSDDRIESLLNMFKKMGMDINEQVKSKDEVRFNPFKLQFPYDASFDKESYSDPTYGPLYFYQTDGDSALHLAAKRAASTDSQNITRQLLSLLLKKGADINLKNKEGKTPVCYSLNSKVLKTLMEAGADLTVIDNNGWNVLMNVIANPSRYKREFDDASMMKMVNILTEKVDINYEAPDSMNALNVALLCGQLEAAKKIQKMMKNSGSITHKSPRLSTLSCLCLSRIREVDVDTQKELVGELLNAGFDALSQDDKGHNALHIACLYRRFDLAKELITHCKQAATLLSAQDNEGYTPLHYAATLYPKSTTEWSESKHLSEIVEKIREHYNHFDSYDLTATLNDVINAAALIENTQGCIFDVVSKNGETPLHSLCRSFQFDKAPVVKQLLLNSANPDIQDIYGQTPLLISCFNLDVKVVKKLLKHKVNVNASDMHGVTAVLAACHGVNKEIEDANMHSLGYYHLSVEDEKMIKKMKNDAISSFREIIALLIKHNADFTVKDKLTWRTPLHIIAGFSFDSSELIEQLVKEQNVDINARDVQNDAPIHFAVRKLNAKHLHKLIELGADINAIGYYGRTPLHNLLRATDYSFFKGNGELMRGGYKILGHSLVYYHSWIWNSIESGLPGSDKTRYSVCTDSIERQMMEDLIVVFFEYADKINFGIKDSDGSLAIHLMADLWREEDNQSAVIINSPVVKKLLTPVQLKLPVPNLFLKYATKEHLSACVSGQHSVLCNFNRFFQIIEGPYQVPKETAIQFMKDVIAKGIEFDESEARYVLTYFTTGSCNIWPEVLDMIFDIIPEHLHEVELLPSTSASSVMHNIFGNNRADTLKYLKLTSAVLLKRAPRLLNTYNGEGLTPLMEAVNRNTHNPHEETVSKLNPAIQILLSQPGIEVNKRHRDTGATALHYAAYNSSFASLIGLFYNNHSYYNNIGVDQALLALLEAGADTLAKDNEGRTPLDILPSMLKVFKKRRKVLLREEKLSLIDKPLMRVDTSGQQHNALVSAYNIDKSQVYQEEQDDEDN